MLNKKIIEDLIQKSGHVIWKNKARTPHYAVVSKSGFTTAAVKFAKDQGVYIFTLEELVLSCDT
jgi:hypothetical protein